MKRYTGITRILWGLLAAFCLFTFVASALLSGMAADHECIGEDCPICMAVSLCRHILRALALLASVGLAATLIRIGLSHGLCARPRVFAPMTPVTLKVKLLN